MENLRTQGVLGKEALTLLKEKTVLVVGVGGVGSFCVEALVRTGIGHLILVDADVFEESNLNRQLPATYENIGQKKVDVLRQRIHSIDPQCEVITHDFFYEASKDEILFDRPIDFVIDCIDSIPSKEDLILACLKRKIPFLCSMGTGRRLDPTKLYVTELEKTSYDPLAKRLRIWKRKQKIRHKIKVVTSSEPPFPQQKDQPLGSVIFVPASAGLLLAKECIITLIQKEG